MLKATKTILFALLYTTALYISIPVTSASSKIDVYFFWGEGCPHCKEEEEYLNVLKIKYNDLVIHDYEVWYNNDNQELLKDISEKLNIKANGVPLTVIGNNYVVGYLSDNTTGKQIENYILDCRDNGCINIFNEDPINSTNNLNLPKVGGFDLSKLSLPLLTIVLGFLDGFNPCAMWVLLFLISMLIGMENKKKMWLLGLTFIVSSAFVYFLFMSAWLNLFLFVGLIKWVRISIGLIAIFGGYLGLKKYLDKKEPGCDVIDKNKKKNVFDKIERIITQKSLFLSLFGISGLAFMVNMVELVCSAGLPAVYTQILTLSNLNTIQYYLYISLYILFFMLDDLFVFFVAMITLQMTGVTTKYVKYSRLFGGILMFIIGILLIFKPEILMFS